MESPSTPVKSLFRGDLAQTPLPEVLITIHRYRAPGVVECVRDGETKRIFIDEGNIIFATSSNVADSLGDRLLQQGVITKTQYEESVVRLAEGKGVKRQGAILVEMRALEPKDLFVSVRKQVQEVVWSVFCWEHGTVAFQPGRDRNREFIKLNIPTRQAVLQGVRSVPDPRFLLQRVGKKTTILMRLSDADFSNLTFSPEEEQLLRGVDGKKSFFDLTNTPPLSPLENAKILYAFFALRLVGVKALKQIKVQVKTR
ncbi:MAG TPA: DUF4388 domain-containing protein [Thermoanaerobaculia bacterium]|nr:DUF4388 domain-containing protein [Thermoanaerobaculia bacterium]